MLLINIHYMRDGVVRFTSLKKSLERQIKRLEKDKKEITPDELKAQRSNFYGIAIEMLNALTEAIFGFDSYTNKYDMFVAMKSHLMEAIKNVKEATSLQPIVDVIEVVLQAFEEFDYNSYSVYDYKSDFRYAYMHRADCTADEFYLQMIGKTFKTKEDRPIRILDPRPRMGESITGFKALMPENTITYAAAVPEREGNLTKQVFDKVALGTLKGSTISNEAFDILFLQPPITLEKQSERLLIKKEKDLIRDTIKYLRPGGYLVLLLPHFRFYKDICLILAKNYTDFQVRKFSGSNFDKTGVVFLIAKKKAKSKDGKEVNPKDYQKLRHLYNLDKVEYIINENFEEVYLPEGETEVKFFRGSVLDIDEIKNIFENSGSMNQFWKEQEVEKLSENPQNPPLPFNTGQLGLVLTSGALDGVVNEGRGHYHVVKGRVVKKTDSERDYLSNQEGVTNAMELVETTSNRVEINVILPDGTHKVLA